VIGPLIVARSSQSWVREPVCAKSKTPALVGARSGALLLAMHCCPRSRVPRPGGDPPRSLGILALLAACAAPPATENTWLARELRVVSYNVRHGRGLDERVDLARTAAVIRALDPDLVALQEIDECVARSGGIDEAAELGRALGMQHAFGSFMDYQGGRYGMAILSRLPIRTVEPITLPPGNEPRVALRVELELPDRTSLSLVGVHFDWVADDTFRFAQALALCERLDAQTQPYLVVGDFNDGPASRTLGLFRARAQEAAKPRGAQATYPADSPTQEIDFVFAAPPKAWSVREVRVVDERAASDHRPVLAVLRLLR
jgi:endonuclease/exonuclease/phosphatase family metal-dependent hydrolase